MVPPTINSTNSEQDPYLDPAVHCVLILYSPSCVDIHCRSVGVRLACGGLLKMSGSALLLRSRSFINQTLHLQSLTAPAWST
jgi:hypothetical protein